MAEPRAKKDVKPVKAPQPAATPRAAVLAMFKAMARGDLPAIRAVVTGKLTGVFKKVPAAELPKIKQAGGRFRKIDRVQVHGERAMVTVVVAPPVPSARKQAYFQKTSAAVIRRLRAETDPTRRLLLERRLHYLAQDLDLMGFRVVRQGKAWRVSRLLFGGK